MNEPNTKNMKMTWKIYKNDFGVPSWTLVSDPGIDLYYDVCVFKLEQCFHVKIIQWAHKYDHHRMVLKNKKASINVEILAPSLKEAKAQAEKMLKLLSTNKA